MKKKFHISDILSVTTQCMVSERHMDGLYDIMGHLSGNKSISTLGLAAIANQARESIYKELPWTKDIQYTPAPKHYSDEQVADHVSKFVGKVASKYGEHHSISQISKKPDTSINADAQYVSKAKEGPRPN